MTSKSKVKINPKRGFYDLKTITKILDETFLCHIGFIINNQPYVIPTCYGREGDRIYFHGSRGSRMLKALREGIEICAAVSIVDGIVLARSAFGHTLNYRSVVIFGKAEEIGNPVEKAHALKTITEHIIPGRWNDVRKPNDKELNITSLFSLSIDAASAKIRKGSPLDSEEDLTLNAWAGELPLKIIPEQPIRNNTLLVGEENHINLPDYIKNYKK